MISYSRNVGLMNSKALVQLNTATSSDKGKNGAQLEIWDAPGTDFTIWVAFDIEKSRPGGAEYFADPERRVEDKATFRAHFSSITAGLDPALNRILFNGKIWNIQRVYDPDGRQAQVHIEANSIN